MDWHRRTWERVSDGLGKCQRPLERAWSDLRKQREAWQRSSPWEWSWDDLVKRVADEAVRRKHFGPMGIETLPGKLSVELRVANGSLATVERFIRDPRFLRQVEALLLNRLGHTPHYGLPVIELEVSRADRDGIVARESAVGLPATLRWRADDSERGGWTRGEHRLDGTQLSFTVGRGPWHGPNDLVRNDVQLPSQARFVSRRAATLHRAGHLLRVSARDQRGYLTVQWNNRDTRPDRAAVNAVEVGVGGTITLTGPDPRDRLVLEVASARAEG